MGDYSIGYVLVIMLSINVVLALVQGAIININPDAQNFIQENSTPIYTMTGGGLSGGLTADKEDIETATADSIDSDTGGVFTDAFKTIRGWFQKLDDRFGLLTGILKQPYGFLKDIGVPLEIATAFGVIWYGLVAVLVIAFFKGGGVN